MLQPSRVKFRKQHTSNFKGQAHSGTTVAFGDFGLQALEQTWLTARQIEAARRAMTRHVKRGGQVWIRIFPDRPISKKPAEVRMGNGKGATDHWSAQIKPGRMLFEMGDVAEDVAKEAMRLAANKLPIRTRFVKRELAVAVPAAEAKAEVA